PSPSIRRAAESEVPYSVFVPANYSARFEQKPHVERDRGHPSIGRLEWTDIPHLIGSSYAGDDDGALPRRRDGEAGRPGGFCLTVVVGQERFEYSPEPE